MRQGAGAITVAGETRAYREGRALAFDDSLSHGVRVGPGGRRVSLVLDVWRPLTCLPRRSGHSSSTSLEGAATVSSCDARLPRALEGGGECAGGRPEIPKFCIFK